MNIQDKKMLCSVTIASMFEIFDFLGFVFLSPIIAKLFFPHSISSLAILFTYMTISISYLCRPVGGIILGHLGDRYGRKSIFVLSIILMSIPSFIIGILPTFNTAGYIGTTLMVLARILQGLSLGGEVPGSITYISERFSQCNYYFYCAWLTFGANIGVAIAAESLYFLLHSTSSNFMYDFGWRIPFLIGGVFSVIAIYIRKSANESPQFKQLQTSKYLCSAPLLTLIQKFKPNIIAGISICIVVSLNSSVFHIFLPSLFSTYFKLDSSIASHISCVGAVTMAIFSLIFAHFSNYIKVIYLTRTSLTILGIILILIILNVIQLNSVKHLYIIVIIISIALSGVNGLFFGILADIFPTQVRFSGISLCYNMAYIVGAGITPLWTTSIISTTMDYKNIIWVCFVVSSISLINTIWLKNIYRKNFAKYDAY